MELTLRFPAKPEFARRFAEELMVTALEVSKVMLDFTPGSLADVDLIIQGFIDEGLAVEDIGETLFSFGCYVGEVFVRHHGAHWVQTKKSLLKGETDFPIVVAIGNAHVLNPIGAVFQRFQSNGARSLPSFYQQAPKSA